MKLYSNIEVSTASYCPHCEKTFSQKIGKETLAEIGRMSSLNPKLFNALGELNCLCDPCYALRQKEKQATAKPF